VCFLERERGKLKLKTFWEDFCGDFEQFLGIFEFLKYNFNFFYILDFLMTLDSFYFVVKN
jgi:hypothetical protein